MATKTNQDIMNAILKGSEDGGPEASSIEKLVHRRGKTERAKHPPAEKTSARQHPRKTPDSENKKKSTHYLSEEIFEDLDTARDKINELVQQRLKSRISKSRIVDQALRMILKDFEKKGEKSPLIKEILKNIQQK